MQHTYHILLVDDEEANRLLLTKRLQQNDYNVTTAENGQQALELMRIEQFDLVLLDMYMPVMDGLATLDAIKSDPVLQGTIVVMLTAANTREHVVHSLSLGAADYMIKPVNPVEFRQRVQHCLGNGSVQTEPTLRVEEENVKGAKILVIDDEELDLMMLKQRLKKYEFDVVTAQGGKQALDLLDDESFDAVLLDVNMPDIDGLEVLSAIRAVDASRALPILILSADGTVDTISRAYGLGASDYLVKPYQHEDLYLRLTVALEVRKKQ